MKLLYFAIIALVAFVAFWVLVVVPAERRHHERKLEALRKRIEKRETRLDEDDRSGAPDDE